MLSTSIEDGVEDKDEMPIWVWE